MMKRPNPGGIAEIVSCLKNIKQNVPDLFIKAQYIVGFPGETDEDTAASVKSIFDSGLDAVNLFKFDSKPNTEAALMPNQLTDWQKTGESK
jgi:tRNA A37 methylthiotransferase MiaB